MNFTKILKLFTVEVLCAFVSVITYDSSLAQSSPPTCVPPPGGLVSWLPGEGNVNDIVGSNNGTLQNGATFASGLVGQAFSFDGTSSVTLSSLPAVSNIGSWTYDLWINVGSYTNGSTDSGDGSYFIDRTSETLSLADLKAVNNQFEFQVRYDGSSTAFGPVGGVISPGVWTHIAMVREYGVAFYLYVNGSLADSVSDNGQSLTPPIPKLGHHDLATLLGFVGLIDEFDIFSRALTDTEIQAIFNAGNAGKCKCPSGTAAGQNWSMNYSACGNDGLVLTDVILGQRTLATRISLPYYRLLDQNGNQLARCELHADSTGNGNQCESKLTGNMVLVNDTGTNLIVSAKYEIDNIPGTPPGTKLSILLMSEDFSS